MPKPVLDLADRHGANVGLRLGASPEGLPSFVFIDFDTEPNADIVCDIARSCLIEALQSPLWIRQTRPGRMGVLFRIQAGQHAGTKAKIQLALGKDELGAVEILARGQQVVVGGTHTHDGGTPIRWWRSDRPEVLVDAPPANEIPVLESRQAFDALMDGCLEVLRGWGFDCQMEAQHDQAVAALPSLDPEQQAAPSAARLIELVDQIPHGPDVDYDRWVTTMKAISGTMRAMRTLGRLQGTDEQDIGHAAARWAARWEDPQGGGTTEEDMLVKWYSDFAKSPAERIGWPYLERLAIDAGVPEARERRAQDAFVADLEAAPASSGSIDGVIAEFNERYMMVNEGGKAVIYAPGHDPVLNRNTLDRMAIADLRALYMNRKVPVGVDEKGRPASKPVADVWLQHDRRRQFIHGVTFDPSPRASAPGVLNLWQGYAVKPKQGNWSLLRTHIRDVICSGNTEHFNYLRGWMARMIQHPAEQGEVAIVLKGGEGTGKGTLAKALLRIMGQHGMGISTARHLVGNFNQHLRDCIFLFADEAFFAGDKQHVGTLKSLITEPYLTIEAKYANAMQMPNFLHVLMASNEEWVVPASLDARRFLVLEVPDIVKRDTAYFGAIWTQMDAGGYEAMLADLLAYDLCSFNVRNVPITAGLHHQRKLSLDTTTAWWWECLERGYVYQSRHGLDDDFRKWLSPISTDLLHSSYQTYAKDHNERHQLSRERLCSFLVKMKAMRREWRNGLVGEHFTDKGNTFGGRAGALLLKGKVAGYHTGSLDDARNAFTQATKLSVVWDD